MNSMVVVENCRRKEVVVTCSLPWEMANTMLEVVENYTRKEVVETCSQLLVPESCTLVVGESYMCRVHKKQQPL